MENFEFIEYSRMRDFGQKVNVTFAFIKQNFTALGKSILFIGCPPILIASLLFGSFVGDMLQFSSSGASSPVQVSNYFLTVGFWTQLGLLMLLLIVAIVMTFATIYNYIILYAEKRSNQIEVSEVWERVRDTFWRYLATAIVYSLLIAALYLAFALFIYLAASNILPEGVAAIACFIIVIIGCYIIVAASLTFVIRAYEDLNAVSAVTRALKLVSGKWWSTFGLIFVLSMIAGTLSYVPLVILSGITLVTSLHSLEAQTLASPGTTMQVVTTVLLTIYYVLYLLLLALPQIGIAFQYFNLIERKEAKGLMSQLENFGQQQDHTNRPHDEHY